MKIQPQDDKRKVRTIKQCKKVTKKQLEKKKKVKTVRIRSVQPENRRKET